MDEFPGQGCGQRGILVRLDPLGLTSSPDLHSAEFCFAAVPPGDYQLSVAPQCNPFGCSPAATDISVVDRNVEIRIPRISCCTGSCSGEPVTVSNILLCANIALGSPPIADCLACDGNQDGSVTVDELLAAVRYALDGCPVRCAGAAADVRP